ncbi:1-phosphatidylinositol phosphodiesterase [Trichoderma arundinaceum]|uniref:1-phosphatidylinositol phosphodiesterase n=1 Tax=Trichoderma arundinaceum TaxID=490622 RepID=A0A395NZH5_TRIAR|nr:1-phosphatidylinositol phosphodiesterase [Trichoderma arundinaceum]
MADLTIRNLTITPLELVSVQRFQGEKIRTGNVVSNVTSHITSFINATDFSAHRILPKGDSQDRRDVSVHLDPFRTVRTDVRSADLAGREILRLTFRAGDRRYETDVPSPSRKSAVMKRVDGDDDGDDDALDLTVVFIPNGAFLAIFSSAKLNAWMKQLDDAWPLPLLSIPGTHNSPTCHTALPSVRCQSVGVPEQLQNGVRFLDIRVSVSPDSDSLPLVHSVFPVSLTAIKYFSDMLDDIYRFLDDNPSETILMSLKREGTGRGTDQHLGRILKDGYVDKRPDRWWTEPSIPTLGRARGRIIVVRRFGLDDEMAKTGLGIDGQHWPDNCEDGTCEGGHIRVQDFYEVTESQNIERKIDYSRGQLERSAEREFHVAGVTEHNPDAALLPIFINFLSGSNFFNATCWPERIAAKVNPAIVEYLCIRHGEDGKGPRQLRVGAASTGVVVTDWVGAHGDWDLIRCIVGWNARLQVS